MNFLSFRFFFFRASFLIHTFSLPAILLFSIIYTSGSIEAQTIYGDIPAEKYLRGEFKPAGNSMFVSLEKSGIPTKGRTLYLRKEAADSLKRMFEDLKKEHPDIPFWVQSATRTFYDQKHIWENKWNGVTTVEGKKLNVTEKDPLRRAKMILRFSSMPGTSRHHWGTDFDINILTNEYYKKDKGKLLFSWLEKNAEKYGFCQPYTKGRTRGYQEESWHWSYKPMSATMLADWIKIYGNKKLPDGSFAGVEAAGHLANEYVTSISEKCK